MTRQISIDPADLAGPLRLQLDNFTDNMWGGDWIPRLKGLPAPAGPVGESWEFSAHPLHPSRVLAGAGVPLPDLLSAAGPQILGERFARGLEGRPPFLLKFIDSRDNLSVQVHPPDKYAREKENEIGKTESWIILDADPGPDGGSIYLGFDRERFEDFPDEESFAEAFLAAIGQANGQGPSREAAVRAKAERLVLPFLNRVAVKAGEVYHVPAGTIHAIGRGVRLFEIQQSSDLTYRVWDWNRPDAAALKKGTMAFRELHLDQARAVMDFHARPADAYRIRPAELPSEGEGARERWTLVKEPERRYAAERWKLGKGAAMNVPAGFSVFTALSGSVEIEVGGRSRGAVAAGASFIVPDAASAVRLRAASGPADLIRSYLPLSV